MICLAAGMLICKVVHSSYAQSLDPEKGKDAFNICVSIFKQSSIENNDIHGRMSKILTQVWAICKSRPEQHELPPKLSVKSRLFSSIVHDSLWLWREKYSGEPNTGAPSLAPPLIPNASVSGKTPTSVESEMTPKSTRPGHLSSNEPSLPMDHIKEVGSLPTDLPSTFPESLDNGQIYQAANHANDLGTSNWDTEFPTPYDMYFGSSFAMPGIDFEDPSWI